jgi:hypothetical protein
MDKQELRQLIKHNCNYSEATIDYLVGKTTIQSIPSFSCNNSVVKYTDVDRYIKYFFNMDKHNQPLIDNGDVDTSSLLTKFKVGDVVYYFDKSQMALIRGQITSIDNHVCLTHDMFKGPYAYSQVGIKRLDEDVDFVCTTITNNDLYLTLEDATQALLDNTFKLEIKRKKQRFDQCVQDELDKFNSVNYH